jgi:signal transduction histidine kinase
VGIPPHARDIIFEEFRQIDGSATRAYKGSGLGLAITRNLVSIMGGHIQVESALGKGSAFTVTLPCVEPARDKTDQAILELAGANHA